LLNGDFYPAENGEFLTAIDSMQAEAKLKEAQAKLKEAEAKLVESEGKLKECEMHLKAEK
jgi:multidrug resistance efflux pump